MATRSLASYNDIDDTVVDVQMVEPPEPVVPKPATSKHLEVLNWLESKGTDFNAKSLIISMHMARSGQQRAKELKVGDRV